MAQPAVHRMSAEAFLAFERAAEQKHEFWDGQAFAMAGARRRHNLITNNIGGELRAALRDGPCEVYTSDQMVRAGEALVYPDISVSCDPTFEGDDLVLVNPVLIVEVLSESTSRHDRGEKFIAYRRVEDLTDYVLVEQRMRLVEHFARQLDGTWALREYRAGVVQLTSIDATLALDEIYLKSGL